MPSALETMVKILKLERDQGAKNTAVVGGLGTFVESWQPQAREQARRAEQHILIDEIVDTLSKYERLEDEGERTTKINYLLDRATNRAQAPPEYEERLSSWQEKMKTRRDSSRDRNRRPDRRDHTDRRQVSTQRSGSNKRSYAYDSATYDEDFTGGPSNIRLDLPPMPRLSVPPRLPRPELTVEEQLALQRELDAPTTSIKGIGNTFAGLLQQLELHTIRDLLFSSPREYRDYTNLAPIKDIQADEEATVIGTVVRSNDRIRQRGRQGFSGCRFRRFGPAFNSLLQAGLPWSPTEPRKADCFQWQSDLFSRHEANGQSRMGGAGPGKPAYDRDRSRLSHDQRAPSQDVSPNNEITDGRMGGEDSRSYAAGRT